jgi:hypothetical protein
MNTRKTIYDKLFTEKVELAKHEVELGLQDDLKQSISFLQKASDAINLSIKGFDDAYKKMQTENKGAKSILETQAKFINKIEATAKDLGINPTQIPNYNEINKSWETLSAAIDKVNQF